MNRKILIFLLVVFSFLAAFLSGYLLSGNSFQKEAEVSDYKTGNILDKFDNEFVISKENSFQQPSLLGKNRVASFTVSSNGSGVSYYEKGTGKVFSVDPLTKEEQPILAAGIVNFIGAIWSPNKKEVISQVSSPLGAQYKYYNFQTKESALLKNNTKSAVFSPDGRQIAKFIFSETENVYNIVISEPAGVASKKIFSTRIPDAEIYWPQDDLLAFKVTDNRGYAKVFSLTKEGALKEIAGDAKNLEIKWSQDGQSFLFSATGEIGRPELFYKSIGGKEPLLLSVSTSASKCAWSIDNKTVICAASLTAEENEELYKISIADGVKQLITPLSQNMRVREILLTNIGDYAIFLNSYDEKLYFLKI